MLASLREMGGQVFLAEVAELFLEETPFQLAAVREAVEGDDTPSTKRTAHALKESSSNIGATRLSEISEILQDAGASGDLSAAPSLLGQLEKEYGRVRTALEAEARKE